MSFNRFVVIAASICSSASLWVLCGWVSSLVTLLLGLICFISTSRLASEVTRGNEQRCSLDRQLIESQKLASIGELSSGIAHEINNPLAIIGQEVEWLKHLLSGDAAKDASQSPEVSDSLCEIVRQVERCREITHKLLDFARKSEPLIQGVDLNKLVEDMAKLVERETVQKQVSLLRDYQQDLPLVFTDGPLVRQVVLNILNNASYAVEKDGSITVKTFMAGNDFVDIQITDTGSGISPENINKIFDPFFTTKPPGKGTGLGLSICHRIIEKLGGHIFVASELGKGTTFIIHLPVEHRTGKQ